jgi:hypothetical protein
MTKQEKLDIKLLMTGIKGSLFPEQWDNIVQEFPFVLQEDEDIDDDAIVKEADNDYTGGNPIEKGEKSIYKKSEYVANNYSAFERYVHAIASAYEVTFQLISGVAKGVEEHVGFYVNSKEAFYRPHSRTDGAISFASNEDEAAYLRSLGYVSLKELKDADNN